MKMESVEQMLRLAQPYGVTRVTLGGCVRGSPFRPGEPGAMRRSAHAHHRPGQPYHGAICFKAHSPERITRSLFWHEVAHIYRRSWTEGECNHWARQQVRADKPLRGGEGWKRHL